MIAVLCGPGCCPGCQDCYGMQRGCHQDPCRCDKSCTCRWADEDTDSRWQQGCERHDAKEDQRRHYEDMVEVDDPESFDMVPCPLCGATTACGYDDSGNPLIHAFHDEEEAS